MNMESVKLVYFSPTGTTKTVARSIAQGINPGSLESIDITSPDARKQPLLTSENELLVVVVPVYMGRVPALLTEWLNALQAHDTPTVCVVVYGNRAYEDALLELKNIVTKCGGIPIACAAYIGEHSFSSSERPVAQGRPDKDDLSHAEAFGRKIREKLESISSVSQVSDVHVPGVYPYTRDSKLWTVDFIAVNDQCTQCGLCAEVCPTSAVDSQNSSLINQEICITCCACIKNCPQNARSMKPSPVMDASIRLNTLFKEPKQPECFL
ncbi:EFR1 family ferrodoxin [Desulfocurvibacter africanus]|uniref:4Fe-4S ferredoxin iron-sulfur binding domain-containing protein n=1 Tax=Desulfocurvibacter africanus subsp. africanus str. Walvis Bay TaxID=690850 RepID=F3YXI1_DESAF|nr:EFR1 family ferrodoxin [Desulfocurvibacter africanus]EGJ51758.1 4Fe-4S ferredoxin iron-sulfur binding domain-containing protein [Desulfocurvibacter africanus subsp. africanus str. Walvis Bay]